MSAQKDGLLTFRVNGLRDSKLADAQLFFRRHPELKNLSPRYRDAFLSFMRHAPPAFKHITKRSLSLRIRADPATKMPKSRKTYSDYLRMFIAHGLLAEDHSDSQTVWITSRGEDYLKVIFSELLALTESAHTSQAAINEVQEDSSHDEEA